MSYAIAPAGERTLTAAAYLGGAAELAAIGLLLGFAARRLRRALLPGWGGPPALIADITVGCALAILLGELLGTFDSYKDLPFLIACAVLAAGSPAIASRIEGARRPGPATAPPAPGGIGMSLVAIACAAIFAAWAIPTLITLAGGMGRADSLWYHMPAAAHFVQTGSTGDLHYVDPIFFAAFYPANSELLHSIGILAFARDIISPVLNLGFLGLGLIAAWSIGRPYGLGPQALLGGAVALGAEMLVNFQAGEALNDIVGVAFVLVAAAILVNGHAARTDAGRPISAGALAVAGLGAGLAAGVKLSFLAPVAVLTIGVIVIAPRGERRRATLAWTLPMLAGGGYWYLRNLAVVGNPIPFSKFGPLGLPSPERAFELRPGFSVAHYFGDGTVWKDWFIPGLHDALGLLWPVTLAALIAGGLFAVWRGGEPILRLLGAMALITAVAYVFTPLTAGGEDGEPIAFVWNVRYLAPAVAIALAIGPCLPTLRATPRRRLLTLAAMSVLVAVTVASLEQWDLGHRSGAAATAALVLVAFAAWGMLASRKLIGAAASARATRGLAVLAALAALAGGYGLQRHYLERRYENLSPQLGLADTIRWARDLRNANLAISGVRGVFNQYPFYGTDVSNRVQWLGIEGPDHAFLRIRDCRTWREQVNEGHYTHVVTMYDPYDPGGLTDTKEALWTREDPHARQILRDGPVSVFEITGRLDPGGCGGLPDLSAAELDGASVNLDPLANQPRGHAAGEPSSTPSPSPENIH